ncbi:MAG: hypothetical protein IT260_09495 [Saprospiraceae bacterium]|nr:hypothetical protein [Saprospiraceae bacterium]
MWKLFCLLALGLLWQCQGTPPQPAVRVNQAPPDTLSLWLGGGGVDTLEAQPIWGYRFRVAGDFNGDGRIDTLAEYFRDSLNRFEIPKCYEGMDYMDLWHIMAAKQPAVGLQSSHPSIPPFVPASASNSLGFVYVHNEGDLNGDGTDELGYVVGWLDASSLNTCHILSLRANRWEELAHFRVREWAIPPLPEVALSYGFMGADGISTNTTNERLNRQRDRALRQFSFITGRTRKGVIRVKTLVEEEYIRPDGILATPGDEVEKEIVLKN